MTNDETDEDLEELIRLEDEFEDMCDAYDVARRGKKYDLARRLGREISAFARRHQQTIAITDEQIDKLAAICRAHETCWTYQEISDSYFKRVLRKADEAAEKSYQRLLEEEPQGKKRTAH